MTDGEIELGARLQSPEGRLVETNGETFTVKEYDIYSGKYTLTSTSYPGSVKRRLTDLQNNWTPV